MMSLSPRALSFGCVLLLASISCATPPVGFTESVVVQNAEIGGATGLAWAPDGSNRLFVIRKSGQVRVVQDGALLPTPFTTIAPIHTGGECGLIGLCFDPDFLTNRYVYFFVTVTGSEQQIIRYRDDNGVGVEPKVIVSDLPTVGVNHNGGAIGIGPDGHLYWAIGDLANSVGVNANLTSLAAKIGRANRFSGQPVADNPFHDGAGSNNDYIWARGFRNPFTMTFQPRTGDLWMNVVGGGYEQVFVVQKGDHAGYNAYENDQPAGFLAPKLAYRTNGTVSRSITASGLTRTGGLTTVVTSTEHGFHPGEPVTISGAGDSSFDGEFFIADQPSPTSFTVSQTGLADTASGGGTAKSANLGGCITGGTFYDSTLFPPEYHGNFFFGDFNSDRVLRVPLDAESKPLRTEIFVTDNNQQVDIATGPDGALYYLGVNTGSLRKLEPEVIAQNLVVHPTALRVPSGGTALFTVRLAQAPVDPVTVTVTKQVGGDDDLTTTDTTLTFTAANWDQLQTVTLAGAVDADEELGSAVFNVHADGLADYPVTATEIFTQPVSASISTLLYRTGDQVPGENPGTTFDSFGHPAFNGESIAFDAVIKQGNLRLPVLVGGSPTQVLWRKGDPAPDLGTAFTQLSDPVFNGGHLAFLGTVANGTGVTAANNQGLWSDAAGALRLIARKGGSAPTTGGARYSVFTAHHLPETGGLIFQARLASGSGSPIRVTARNDVGLWREGPVEPELLLREGDSITVAPDDERVVQSFQVFPNITGSADQRRSVLVDGTIFALVTFTDRTQALLKLAPGTAAEVVTLTAAAPLTPMGASLKTLGTAASFAGGSVFRGVLTGGPVTAATDTALLAVSGTGELTAPVQEGGPLGSLGGAQFSVLDLPAFAGGEMLFTGTLRSGIGGVTSRSDRGLFRGTGSAITPLAQEGQALGDRIFDKVLHFAAPSEASSTAVTAFLAQFRTGAGGVTTRDDLALSVRAADGTLHILQLEGDLFQLSPTLSARITAFLAFQASVRTPGQGRAISPTGKVLYRATLGRHGQAIIQGQVPQ